MLESAHPHVLELRGSQLRLGIKAPKNVGMHWDEIYRRIKADQSKPRFHVIGEQGIIARRWDLVNKLRRVALWIAVPLGGFSPRLLGFSLAHVTTENDRAC